MSLLFATALVLLLNTNFCLSQQAPYEVSIRLKYDKFTPYPIHICNGVIISHNLILTTADCLFVQRQGEKNYSIVRPSELLVYAGSNSSIPPIVKDVKYYEIKENFNPDTLENDIATLTLNSSISNRTDINWIMIDNLNSLNQTCMATFTNTPSAEATAIQPYLTQIVKVRDPIECSRLGNYTQGKRQQDICSDYFIGQGVMCDITESRLRKTVDRGTPLVCNNKVVGLFSSTIIPKESSVYRNLTCYQVRHFNAYYTRLALHGNWIYEKVTKAKSELMTTTPIYSPPYYTNISQNTVFTTPKTHSSKKNSAESLNFRNAIFTTIVLLLTKLLLL